MLQDLLTGRINLIEAVVFLGSLLIAVTVHEFSHAWMADRLGDPTAKLKGRLTLNPLAHLDPVGTILLLTIGFGWGKPVPVYPGNFRNPRKDEALVSAAGAGSNLLLAVILSLILRSTLYAPVSAALNLFAVIIAFLIRLNVMLAVFNLVPVSPLDGGAVLVGILPEDLAREVSLFLKKNGLLLLIILVFPLFGGSSLIFRIISPVINFLLSVLIPGSGII